jgi:hypothetical protein
MEKKSPELFKILWKSCHKISNLKQTKAPFHSFFRGVKKTTEFPRTSVAELAESFIVHSRDPDSNFSADPVTSAVSFVIQTDELIL